MDLPRSYLPRFAALTLLLLFGLPAAMAADSARPMIRESQKVFALFLAGEFAELEATEARTRDLSVLISDGQPLRAAFFWGFWCPCESLSEEEARKMLAQMRQRVGEWRKRYPESIAAKIAESRYYGSVAWHARGKTWAHKVPESAWPIYRENLEKSRRLLDAMGPGARSEPQWYTDRLMVGRELSEPRETYAQLLAEALERHPRYLPIYFEASTHYSPSWGGSNAELNAFIDRAVERTRAHLGDSLYARLHWNNWSREMFSSGQADWPRMKAAFERIIADHPDAWNMNNFGKFACMARDPATMEAVIKRLDGLVVLEAWQGMAYYSWCRKAAQFATGQ